MVGRLMLVLAGLTLAACGTTAAPSGDDGGGATGGTGGTGSGSTGTLQGRLVLQSCPPVQVDDSPCDQRPIGGTVLVRRGVTDKQPSQAAPVARATVSAGQTFRFDLDPGSYLVEGIAGTGPGACKPVDADVVAGRVTRVDVICDSGIR